MKRFILLVLYITIFYSLSAKVFPRKINWIAETENNVRVGAPILGGILNDYNLPVYQETFTLEQNENIRIINPVFLDVSENENFNKSAISPEFVVDPAIVYSSNRKSAWIEFVPLIKYGDQVKKLVSFEIETYLDETNRLKSAKVEELWKTSSVLSSGKWVKIRTVDRGIHKITFDQLEAWGFSNPSKVNLYGNGGFMLPKMNDDFFYDDLEKNAIWHGKDGGNKDCLFFYSTGTVKWLFDESDGLFKQELNDYSDYAYYFLSDVGESRFVETVPEESGSVTSEINSFQDYSYLEEEKENIIKSGRRWFGDKFSRNQQRSYSFSIKNIDNSQPVKLFIEGAARSSQASTFNVQYDVVNAGTINFQALNTGNLVDLQAYVSSGLFSIDDPASDFDIGLKYQASNTSALGWLDFITVNAQRNLVLDNDQLAFRDITSIGEGNIVKFNLSVSNSNLEVWDVTDYLNPKSIDKTVTDGTASFKVLNDKLHEYVAFYPEGDIQEPEKVNDVVNQNLHQQDVSELIIITHPNFLNQANELADFHRSLDGMTVKVLTPEVIYNEFSSGQIDIAGIRNFLRMCYDRSIEGSGLKYVLFLGDGSYDNKNILGHGNNFLPTYQSENSLVPTSSFVTDDFFVLLDRGEGEYAGLIDLGVGRIPAGTVAEAQLMIQKIKNYVDAVSLGDWRNVVCFIGDDEDNNTHMTQAEDLAKVVNESNPAFYTDKIYFDAYQEESTPGGERYPDVTNAINNRVKNGALILNYTGHANETSLAHERVLETNDIDGWSNYNRLPIFVTATCEISRFDSDEKSGGEHILFNANGGGIGLFSTTRLVYSNPNFILNKEFYEHVFSQDENGENLRMGEIMKRSKNGVNTGINKRNFTLLADPALRLSYPKFKVVTETINGVSVDQELETITSLSTVTITGRVTDHTGNTLTNFDGELIPVVYDKADTVETLGNGGEDPMSFSMQSNIIYKGVASVSQGNFQFTFIVPKDISYSLANGKIIYYADNGEDDAQGYTTDFYIGGSSGIVIIDQEGPEINLFLNDESFKDGDEVGKNPILFANVMDEHGINTVGTGIGHDITAVLDGDFSNVVVLNDFYLSDRDSYQSGQIIYPLRNLSVGGHTLRVKVWDVLNNSSEVEIHFVVTSNLEIEEVSCYPNPVTDYTNFVFKHNRPDESFDTTVEVFDMSGSLLDILNQRVGSSGDDSLPMLWQVTNSTLLYRSGAYLYRITIVADDGASAAKTGRMIISRY
ncbi:type IX secretion system sortase PorU [Sunxiuqinia sp. A32]|uniref:type IX secretion system sortase PorU n=1 Tax=Sunxiuqinia sp. A32 TaxID=3461496 RepID=UPI004045440B